MIFDSLGTLPLGTIPISIVVDIGIDPITHHHYIDSINLTSLVNITVNDVISDHKTNNVVVFILGELGTFEIVLNTTVKNTETLFIIKELTEILKVFLEKYSLESAPDQKITLYTRQKLETSVDVINYFKSQISVLNNEIIDIEVRNKEVN
jgi:hypothetical protein